MIIDKLISINKKLSTNNCFLSHSFIKNSTTRYRDVQRLCFTFYRKFNFLIGVMKYFFRNSGFFISHYNGTRFFKIDVINQFLRLFCCCKNGNATLLKEIYRVSQIFFFADFDVVNCSCRRFNSIRINRCSSFFRNYNGVNAHTFGSSADCTEVSHIGQTVKNQDKRRFSFLEKLR